MNDPEITIGLVNGDTQAAVALFDKYNRRVNQLVRRLLGADSEHDDVVHTVYIQILTSVKNLKKPEALPEWITGIAINTVRKEIRNRRSRTVLRLVSDIPETGTGCSCDGAQVSLKRVFGVLNEMNSDDHIVFVLRFVERNTLEEIAAYCGWSLATARRKIHRAKDAFIKRAGRDAILSGWINGYKTGYVI